MRQDSLDMIKVITSCGGTSKLTVLRSTQRKLSTHGMTKNIPGPWHTVITHPQLDIKGLPSLLPF